MYGVVNEWRPSTWRVGIISEYGWETYPEEIREVFTFEQVQQIADSFKLLLPPDELEEALDVQREELEQYQEGVLQP